MDSFPSAIFISAENRRWKRKMAASQLGTTKKEKEEGSHCPLRKLFRELRPSRRSLEKDFFSLLLLSIHTNQGEVKHGRWSSFF